MLFSNSRAIWVLAILVWALAIGNAVFGRTAIIVDEPLPVAEQWEPREKAARLFYANHLTPL